MSNEHTPGQYGPDQECQCEGCQRRVALERDILGITAAWITAKLHIRELRAARGAALGTIAKHVDQYKHVRFSGERVKVASLDTTVQMLGAYESVVQLDAQIMAQNQNIDGFVRRLRILVDQLPTDD